jgi:hypothetical protein
MSVLPAPAPPRAAGCAGCDRPRTKCRPASSRTGLLANSRAPLARRRRVRAMSALTPKADIRGYSWNVRFVPKPTSRKLFELTKEAPAGAIIMPKGYARHLPRKIDSTTFARELIARNWPISNAHGAQPLHEHWPGWCPDPNFQRQ